MSDITVVYIAGQGRSGSTLLDLLAGRLDGWFSMGEFRLFWHAVRDEYRCACGEPVLECPVWSDVLARSQTAAVTDVLADLKATVRFRRVPGLLAPALLGSHRAARDRSARALGDVYRAVAESTGASVLVDSSKDPIYGLLLRGAPGIKLHVVHLVRDPRAVAWSWQRKRVRPEVVEREAYQPVYSALHTSLEWDLRNALVHVLGRGAAGYARVTYEALVDDPAGALARIERAVTGTGDGGADAAAALAAATGGVELVNHTVAGNPMRFEGAFAVKPDEEWKHALGRRDRRLVAALTWPLLRWYGYI